MELVQLKKTHSKKPFEIIGIIVNDSVDNVKRFQEENNINYPLIFETETLEAILGPIRSIPTSFILDKEFKQIDRVLGYHNKAFFESKISSKL